MTIRNWMTGSGLIFKYRYAFRHGDTDGTMKLEDSITSERLDFSSASLTIDVCFWIVDKIASFITSE